MSTIILGIESSCDDTSAAIIVDGVLKSNVIASQKFMEIMGAWFLKGLHARTSKTLCQW